jgi:hypothetical protein
MSKKLYRLTDQANDELRRRAPQGEIALTLREAKYELMRGTVELAANVVVAERAKPAGA